MPGLTLLALGNNGMKVEGARALAAGLGGGGGGAGSAGGAPRPPHMHVPLLSHLHLPGNVLGDGGVMALVAALRDSSTLR